MEFKNNIKNLRDKCETFLQQVEFVGNECSYTDRLLEEIISESETLKRKYSRM